MNGGRSKTIVVLLPTEGSTQKQSSLLLTTLIGIGIGIVALAHASMAQTSAAPAKAGTRLITLGTAAGASPRAHRAQSSNLLIVNGALYVIDAGDSVARRAGLYPELR